LNIIEHKAVFSKDTGGFPLFILVNSSVFSI
jgi:hypothetical protein